MDFDALLFQKETHLLESTSLSNLMSENELFIKQYCNYVNSHTTCIYRTKQIPINNTTLIDDHLFESINNNVVLKNLTAEHWKHILLSGSYPLIDFLNYENLFITVEDKHKAIKRFKNSIHDIDLFLYGFETQHDFNTFVGQLIDYIKQYVLIKSPIVTRNAITITTVETDIKFQIILTNYQNPLDIYNNFDLDCVKIGYTNQKIVCTPRGIASTCTISSIVTSAYIDDERVRKYIARNYNITFPFVNPHKMITKKDFHSDKNYIKFIEYCRNHLTSIDKKYEDDIIRMCKKMKRKIILFSNFSTDNFENEECYVHHLRFFISGDVLYVFRPITMRNRSGKEFHVVSFYKYIAIIKIPDTQLKNPQMNLNTLYNSNGNIYEFNHYMYHLSYIFEQMNKESLNQIETTTDIAFIDDKSTINSDFIVNLLSYKYCNITLTKVQILNEIRNYICRHMNIKNIDNVQKFECDKTNFFNFIDFLKRFPKNTKVQLYKLFKSGGLNSVISYLESTINDKITHDTIDIKLNINNLLTTRNTIDIFDENALKLKFADVYGNGYYQINTIYSFNSHIQLNHVYLPYTPSTTCDRCSCHLEKHENIYLLDETHIFYHLCEKCIVINQQERKFTNCTYFIQYINDIQNIKELKCIDKLLNLIEK